MHASGALMPGGYPHDLLKTRYIVRTASSTTSVLSVRVNSDERAVLEAAAEQAHTSLSEFVRRKALESAETEMLNRTVVSIPAKDWDAFEAWVRLPAKAIPALAELARRTPTWEG